MGHGRFLFDESEDNFYSFFLMFDAELAAVEKTVQANKLVNY